MNVMNLIATLTLNSSKFDAGLKNSQKAGSSFASKISTTFKAGTKVIAGMLTTITAVGSAIAAASLKLITMGDDIDKTSQKLGMSTDGYQKWALAAQMAGTDASTLQTGIRQLNTYIDDLTKGQGAALLTLQSLGIGYSDFMDMNFDEQFYSIVSALQGIENSTDKARLAQELFGSRAYQELLPLLNQEKGSIDELFSSFEEMGLIVDEAGIKKSAQLNDKLTVLKASVKNTALALSVDMFDSLSNVADGLQGLITGSDGATESLTTGLLGIIKKTTEAAPELINSIGDIIIAIVEGITSEGVLQKLVSGIFGIVETLLIKVIELLPALSSTFLSLVAAVVDTILSLDWQSLLGSFGKFIVDFVNGLLVLISQMDWANLISGLLLGIVDIVITILTTPDLLSNILNAVVNVITGVFNGLTKTVTKLIKEYDIASIAKNVAKTAMDTISNFVKNTGLASVFDTAKNWINGKMSEVGTFFRKFGINVVNAIIDGLNRLGSYTIPGLKIGTWQVYPDTSVKLFSIPKIEAKAQGGMLDKIGTLYNVGESGAEIVAQSSRGTGVANIDQIAQAQYNAMFQYGMKEEIRKAVVQIVNAIDRNGVNARETSPYMGKRDQMDNVIYSLNDILSKRGQRTLSSVTSY